MIRFFKGVLIGFGFLILVLLVMAGFMALLVTNNNADKSGTATSLQGKSQGARKALVVYQPSLTATSTKLAEQIARGLQEGGCEVTLSHPGKALPADMSGYDLLVMGSPVFAGQPSAALLGYAGRLENLESTAVALYSVGAAVEAPEIDLIRKAMKSDEARFTTKLKAGDKSSEAMAFNWGKTLAEGAVIQ